MASARTWSGSFTNEDFVGPGTYQAKNGVRCYVDMKTAPGDVVIATPNFSDDNSSFIISWDNPFRHQLTFVSAGELFEDPTTIERKVGPAFITELSRGLIAYSLLGNIWELFGWTQFNVTPDTEFAIAWRGRATNGLCEIVNEFHGREVRRIDTGIYLVRLDDGTLDNQVIMQPIPQAVGLPDDTTPEIIIQDIGMSVPDEIQVNSGYRNKNGKFFDDDLIQRPENLMALIGSRVP